jgi:hypothetical protein
MAAAAAAAEPFLACLEQTAAAAAALGAANPAVAPSQLPEGLEIVVEVLGVFWDQRRVEAAAEAPVALVQTPVAVTITGRREVMESRIRYPERAFRMATEAMVEIVTPPLMERLVRRIQATLATVPMEVTQLRKVALEARA